MQPNSEEIEWVRKVFTKHIPEMGTGRVLLRQITRNPGKSCQVIVDSPDPNIEAFAYCTGLRQRAIFQEFGPEKLEITSWKYLQDHAAQKQIQATKFFSSTDEVLRKTERVFRFYGITVEPRTTMDFGPCIQQLPALCQEQRKDEQGVVRLRKLKEMFDAVCPPNSGTSEQFQYGQKLVKVYTQWLIDTFPVGKESNCAHPSKKLGVPCERCGESEATVHTMNISPDGIERHNFCQPCHAAPR